MTLRLQKLSGLLRQAGLAPQDRVQDAHPVAGGGEIVAAGGAVEHLSGQDGGQQTAVDADSKCAFQFFGDPRREQPIGVSARELRFEMRAPAQVFECVQR